MKNNIKKLAKIWKMIFWTEILLALRAVIYWVLFPDDMFSNVLVYCQYDMFDSKRVGAGLN